VLRILGLKTRCHTISIHLLLIASTAQGIAPDRHSLASLRALHVLWLIPISSESTGDEDDSPEEGIEATEPKGGSVSRLLAGRLKDPAALTVRVIAFDPLRSCCPRGNLLTPDRLSIILCRLTC
jgi:hypothetical protein